MESITIAASVAVFTIDKLNLLRRCIHFSPVVVTMKTLLGDTPEEIDIMEHDMRKERYVCNTSFDLELGGF